MLAAPNHGFVFLAAPKSASTSIEMAFGRFAQLTTKSAPGLKHASAPEFESRFAPLLASYGFARDSYETTGLLRHPIDLAVSWWRYRSRPALRGQSQYTGDQAFDEFAAIVVAGRGRFRRLRDWAGDAQGNCLLDRPFRYENIADCVHWLEERVGRQVAVPDLNVSPRRDPDMSPVTRRDLEHFFAVDIALYEAAD